MHKWVLMHNIRNNLFIRRPEAAYRAMVLCKIQCNSDQCVCVCVSNFPKTMKCMYGWPSCTQEQWLKSPNKAAPALAWYSFLSKFWSNVGDLPASPPAQIQITGRKGWPTLCITHARKQTQAPIQTNIDMDMPTLDMTQETKWNDLERLPKGGWAGDCPSWWIFRGSAIWTAGCRIASGEPHLHQGPHSNNFFKNICAENDHHGS